MRQGSLARWFSRLTGVTALLIAGAACAADVHVMISAGFYHAYSGLVPAFEKASGHRLVTTRGPSLGDSPESIPNRLKRGETADVVIMVGASVDDLGRQGLVRSDSKVNLAQSQIGMVVRGEAEIGFQQVSELIHTPGVTFVGAIPAELQQETFFSAVLGNSARQPEAAGALIRFLASPEAAPAITKAGLAPVAGR